MILPYFTKEELQDLGFSYNGLTKEDEFQYDWWTFEVCGAFIDVTFEYDLNSTEIKTSFVEINNYKMSDEISKNDVVIFLNFLKNIN